MKVRLITSSRLQFNDCVSTYDDLIAKASRRAGPGVELQAVNPADESLLDLRSEEDFRALQQCASEALAQQAGQKQTFRVRILLREGHAQ